VASADSVTVTLQGRDIERFRYTGDAWEAVLRALTDGMTVYADVIDVQQVHHGGDASPDTAAGVKAPNGLEITYALLITSPGARGHHFLRRRDLLEPKTNTILTNEIRFTPYIRTDNLKDLFATPPDREETLGLPVKVRPE
jgi:hypothetical protein